MIEDRGSLRSRTQTVARSTPTMLHACSATRPRIESVWPPRLTIQAASARPLVRRASSLIWSRDSSSRRVPIRTTVAAKARITPISQSGHSSSRTGLR